MDVRRTHRYDLAVTWTGNRGSGTRGYRDYGRDHVISADGHRGLAGEHDAAKVIARQRVGDAFDAVAALRTDPVERVRAASVRAVTILTAAGA